MIHYQLIIILTSKTSSKCIFFVERLLLTLNHLNIYSLETSRSRVACQPEDLQSCYQISQSRWEADNMLVVFGLFQFPYFQSHCWSPAASLLAILIWPFCCKVIVEALNSSLWDLSGYFNLKFRNSPCYNPKNQHIQADPQLSVHFSPRCLLSLTVGTEEHSIRKKTVY